MVIPTPIHATDEVLRRLVDLVRSDRPFLSLYIRTPAKAPAEEVQLRAVALLSMAAERVARTSLAAEFPAMRARVERFLESLGPGGDSLAVFCSSSDWHTLWLPDIVEEHARFGPGIHALPLIDLLQVWRPVGYVQVARERARVAVLAGGDVREVTDFESEVPGRHGRGPGAAPRYGHSVSGMDAVGGAGGGAADKRDRHILVHVEEHLQRAVSHLDAMHRKYRLRTLFLSGPVETVAQFKALLSHEQTSWLAGDLAVDAHASLDEVRRQVLSAAHDVEQARELAQVDDLITRAAKRQQVVAGLSDTLWALDNRELHLLVMAAGPHQSGRRCAGCDLLLPPDDRSCPRCGGQATEVDLWEELPRSAMGRRVGLEIVHAQAAEELRLHGGIAGVLKPPIR